jgi:putative spermidine/putrescine transport system ATP-binding protein
MSDADYLSLENLTLAYGDTVAVHDLTLAMGRDEVERRVAAGLASVGLTEFRARRPAELSGGQQQRVALARSMVMEPKVLLLDEPLSNLDARLRLEMRAELQRVQKASGITMIFVTHDQAEALALADRIVVMLNGGVEQIGSSQEIYNAPRSAFVADFVGFDNVFALDGGRLKTPAGPVAIASAPAGVAGLAWRPGMVVLGQGPFRGTVLGTSFAGRAREYLLQTPLGPIKAEADVTLPAHALGAEIAFDLPVERAARLERFG